MTGAIAKRKLTVAEYLEIERKAVHKSEFFDGEMFAMAGANNERNIVKEKLVGEMFNRLKGTSCRSYSSDQRVLVDPTGLYAYPDVVPADAIKGSKKTGPTGIVP